MNIGPKVFYIGSRMYKREDFELICPHGHLMKCSYFDSFFEQNTKSCVLYLHGNSSSRIESIQSLDSVLPLNMSLMAFDFPGCGLSEGSWVSLGFYEKEDSEKIIQFLQKVKGIRNVLLWGRSMGASITIMLSENKSNLIAGIVADSPYANLKRLCFELGNKKSRLVKYVFDRAWRFMKEKIQKAYRFDIDELDIVKYAKNGNVPVLIICSKDDEIIQFEHGKEIFDEYKNEEKKIMIIKGKHNETREKDIVKIAADFLWESLKNKQRKRGRSTKRMSLG